MVNRFLQASLSGAGCMVFFVAVAVLASAGLAKADEKSDRDRKIRIALALAEAEASAAKAKIAAGKPELAPQPRVVGLVGYGKGYEQSTEDHVPLVVYVGCDGPKIDGAATVRVESFPDVTGPAVVVAYPAGNRVVTDRVFKGKPTDAELQKATNDARKKMDTKHMPAGKPLPPPCASYMISAERGPCVCGDSCKCPEGKCPAVCPLTYAQACVKVAAGETVYLSIGKRVGRVQVCKRGQCRVLDVTAHADALTGFPDGVYECFLLNGKPVMVRVGG